MFYWVSVFFVIFIVEVYICGFLLKSYFYYWVLLIIVELGGGRECEWCIIFSFDYYVIVCLVFDVGGGLSVELFGDFVYFFNL